MIEVGDIVRFVTWENHAYGSMLRPLLEAERGNLFVVVSEGNGVGWHTKLDGNFGRTFLLERFNNREQPFHPGNRIDTVWEGWLVKDEFLTAVRRAVRLDPDVVNQDATESR